MEPGFDAGAFHRVRRGPLGADLRWHASLASTQDAAREAAASGAGAGCVVLAGEQSAGRGRWGRSWISPPGAGLLFSALVEAPPPGRDSELPVLLGLATVLALRGLGLPGAGLKWPNDVVWRGRKLGGLLVEAAGALRVAGCGLNLLQGEADWPDGLRGQAASLRQAGLTAPREAVLAAVLGAWETALEGWRRGGLGAFEAPLRECDALVGRECGLASGRETLRGRVLGIAADGSLRLAVPDGREVLVRAAAAMELRPLPGA